MDDNSLLNEIGMAGQERLAGAHALVVGVGGLGSPVVLYLASATVEGQRWSSVRNLAARSWAPGPRDGRAAVEDLTKCCRRTAPADSGCAPSHRSGGRRE